MADAEAELARKQRAEASKKVVQCAAKRAGVILDDDTLSSVCTVRPNKYLHYLANARLSYFSFCYQIAGAQNA